MIKVDIKTEQFFREVRKIEVFSADSYPFEQSFMGEIFNISPMVVFENIIPEDFERSIKRKQKSGNDYYEINLSFGVHHFNPLEDRVWRLLLNERAFVVVLQTNTDFMVLGNKNEPLTVEYQDRKKDDNSGTDKYEVLIFGETIIEPIVHEL